MEKEFDVGFLGLNGTIDTEVAQAMFTGDGDITKFATSVRYLSDMMGSKDIYYCASRIMKIEWDKAMRREGVRYFSGNYTENHPPTLLKNKDAEVVATLVADLAPDFRALFEEQSVDNAKTESAEENMDTQPNEESDDPLLDILFENYFRTIFSGMSDALQAKADSLDVTMEDLPVEVFAAALDGWADEMLAQELPIMITGQKAKELFKLSKNIPQETDFSNRPGNKARQDAERKLFHTRTNVSVILFQDDIHDPELRSAALSQVSVEELAAGSAYVDEFLKSLNDTDREITEMLLQKFTQQEIAEKLGVRQPMVSKHIKKIQQQILKFDPEIRKILPLFGKK
ncbi:MAG: sigma-70 family RNA polymerase sigma factor [Clostridia bacterium]|nr:sigma-70 family RNA polymerase sigma factor [Clostridia bacterium]